MERAVTLTAYEDDPYCVRQLATRELDSLRCTLLATLARVREGLLGRRADR